MLEKVWEYICRYRLFTRGDFVVLGVSGGADSMALLHILNSLRDRLDMKLQVAHLNHGIRGEEAREDAAFVENAARALEIPCTLGEADVPGMVGKFRLSTEEAARKARYEFLFRVAQDLGSDRIAVAHNAHDQAETLLMHLLNGTGPEGLAGMRPVSGIVVRPLLEIKRQEIEDYCFSSGIPFRTDSSNSDLTFLRNRIRHELMPQLVQYNPNIVETLLRTAEIIRGENDYIEGEAFLASRQALKPEGKKLSLEGKLFSPLNLALQRRLIRQIYRKLAGDDFSLGFGHVERVRGFVLSGQTGKVLELPGNVLAEKTYAGVIFYVSDVSDLETLMGEKPIAWDESALEFPGITYIDAVHAKIEAAIHSLDEVKNKVYMADPEEAFLDFDSLEPPLKVGPIKQGDAFHPLGSSGSKKVKDFLIDAKVPRQQRKTVPVVSDAKGILWIAGIRIDERVKVTDGTSQVLHLRVSENP